MKPKNTCPECGTPLDQVPFKTDCKAHAAHNKLWEALANIQDGIHRGDPEWEYPDDDWAMFQTDKDW